MKNISINEKIDIFTTCHKLTRALVDNAENSAISYHATFTACLKLYYSDLRAFLKACKTAKIGTTEIASVNNEQFDIFKAFAENDVRKIESLLSFAFFSGLKREDAYRTRYETINDIESDNIAPKAVDRLCANDIEDTKNDIACYLLSRANDAKFCALPNIYKLILAGESCVSNAVDKIKYRFRNESFSIDEMAENVDIDKMPIYEDKREFFADIDKFDLIEFIIDNLPKARRATPEKRAMVRSFLHAYYSNHGKSGMRLDTLAERYNVSIRTLKGILADVRSIGYNTLANREKSAD